MNDDSDIRALFNQQRTADHSAAPAYQSIVARATAAAQPSPSSTSLWKWGSLASGLAVVTLATFSLWQSISSPSLVESLPVLLPSSNHDVRLFSELPLDDDSMPSDFLLPSSFRFSVL